jgi:uncharacterized protein involved in response to NO
MSATSSEQIRAWRGPAILSYGFRPFFFGAAVWAMLAMMLWTPMLMGRMSLPTAFDPVSWHAHEFLYGYLGAVSAGFLLTAVPNWTGRLPIVGWRLGALALLWLAGRLVVAVSAQLPPWLVAAIDLAFPVVFTLAIGREIVAGKNWRNLIVLAMLAVLTLGNILFHWEAAHGVYAAQGIGLRLGLGVAIMMIAVIGGRIVPSFTRNWLAKRPAGPLPAPPMQTFDHISLAALVISILIWVVTPTSIIAGIGLLIAGGLHFVRLARWCGYRTLAEPLVLVLHIGYLFLPLGAIAMGVGMIWPETIGHVAAQHLWMAGAIGLMTLAVMTRASLGHTGQPLTANRATIIIYVAMFLATIARFTAGVWPDASSWLHPVSGLLWIAAFGGFAVSYGPTLLRARHST